MIPVGDRRSASPSRRRLLVLGGTGGTGQQVISQALQRGHEVTAFVRSPQRLTITNDRLRVLAGSVTDDSRALADAVRDQDAVISTLGAGRSFKSGDLISQTMPRIVGAMENHGVRRLIFTSAFGVGLTHRDVPLVPRLFMRLLLRDIYRDKASGEATLRDSGLDWTLVYPIRIGRWCRGRPLSRGRTPLTQWIPSDQSCRCGELSADPDRRHDLREEGCPGQFLSQCSVGRALRAAGVLEAARRPSSPARATPGGVRARAPAWRRRSRTARPARGRFA